MEKYIVIKCFDISPRPNSYHSSATKHSPTCFIIFFLLASLCRLCPTDVCGKHVKYVS